MPHLFLIRKTQIAKVPVEFQENETVSDVLERIDKTSKDDLEWEEAEYELIGITEEHGKHIKLLWFLDQQK